MYSLEVKFDHGKVIKQMVRAVITRCKLLTHERVKHLGVSHHAIQYKTIRYNIGRQTGLSEYAYELLDSGFHNINTEGVEYTDVRNAEVGVFFKTIKHFENARHLIKDNTRGVFVPSDNLLACRRAAMIEILFVDMHSCAGGSEDLFWDWFHKNGEAFRSLKAIVVI